MSFNVGFKDRPSAVSPHNLVSNLSKVLVKFGIGVATEAVKQLPLNTDPVKKTLEFLNGEDYPELAERKAEEVLPSLPFEKTWLIRQCMKPLSECDNDGDVAITDADNVFVARCGYGDDMSVTQARTLGLILPANLAQNSIIKPLFIRCFGVGSGKTGKQIMEGFANVAGIGTHRLDVANSLVKSYVENEQAKMRNRNQREMREGGRPEVLVPIITGFSLGGKFALPIAVKNKWTSFTYNPLGMGREACDWVGREKWNEANTTHRDNHITLSMNWDFTSSKASPLRHLTRIPGQVLTFSGTSSDPVSDAVSVHCEGRRELDKFMQRSHFAGDCLRKGRRAES